MLLISSSDAIHTDEIRFTDMATFNESLKKEGVLQDRDAAGLWAEYKAEMLNICIKHSLANIAQER